MVGPVSFLLLRYWNLNETLTCDRDILLRLNCFVSLEADINSRDYSGKKPKQVARDCLTIEAQGTWLDRIELSSHAVIDSS